MATARCRWARTPRASALPSRVTLAPPESGLSAPTRVFRPHSLSSVFTLDTLPVPEGWSAQTAHVQRERPGLFGSAQRSSHLQRLSPSLSSEPIQDPVPQEAFPDGRAQSLVNGVALSMRDHRSGPLLCTRPWAPLTSHDSALQRRRAQVSASPRTGCGYRF